MVSSPARCYGHGRPTHVVARRPPYCSAREEFHRCLREAAMARQSPAAEREDPDLQDRDMMRPPALICFGMLSLSLKNFSYIF